MAGNDRADELAKMATEDDTGSEESVISTEEFATGVKKWIMEKWTAELPQEDAWNPNPALWERLKVYPKVKAKRITEILTGHGNFRNIMQNRTKPVCKCVDCVSYRTNRLPTG